MQEASKGIPFSVVSCVVGTFLVLACIVLAYIAGVMSGRASAARDNVRLGYSQSSGSVVPVPGEEKVAGVLSPEELEYARALRSDAVQRGKRNAFAGNAGMSPKKDIPETVVAQKNASAESAINREGSMVVGGHGSADVKQTPGMSSPPEMAALFDYVFQVAAMRTEDSVDALRQRLEGRGLRTRMQRDGKMFYVLVMLRGDESRATEVVQTLDSMRLGKPLMRSRKPVVQ